MQFLNSTKVTQKFVIYIHSLSDYLSEWNGLTYFSNWKYFRTALQNIANVKFKNRKYAHMFVAMRICRFKNSIAKLHRFSAQICRMQQQTENAFKWENRWNLN